MIVKYADDLHAVSEELRSGLKRYRRDNGLTQAEMARRLHITQSAVSSFEIGKNKHLRLDTAILLRSLIDKRQSTIVNFPGTAHQDTRVENDNYCARTGEEELIHAEIFDRIEASRFSDGDILYYFTIFKSLNVKNKLRENCIECLVANGIGDAASFASSETKQLFLMYGETLRLSALSPQARLEYIVRSLDGVNCLPSKVRHPWILFQMHCEALRDRGSAY